MNSSLRWLLIAAVSLLAGWAGYQAGRQQDTGNSSPAPANSKEALARLLDAPVTDLNGQPKNLDEWKGKLLVVNLWAAWCPPCRAEMPAFSRIQQNFADKDVQFIGIALDDAAPVQEFLRSTPVSYPILLAPPTRLELSAPLGNSAQGLPFSFIVDRQGQLAATRLGQWNEADLTAELNRLLVRK